MPTVLLIDVGSFFIQRIFHAVDRGQSGFSDEDAVETLVQSVIRLILREDSAYALCAFDSLSESTWHHALVPSYKPKSASLPERYRAVIPQALDALAEAGVRTLSVPYLESDDVLTSVCRRLSRESVPVRLVSNNIRLIQMLGPGVVLAEPFSDIVRDAKWLDRRFGIQPYQIPAYLALAGARSGLSGVPGIGPKRASGLLCEYGGLDQILTAANQGALPRSLGDNLSLFAPTVRILEQLYAARTEIFFGLNVKDLHLERNLHGSRKGEMAGSDLSSGTCPSSSFAMQSHLEQRACAAHV